MKENSENVDEVIDSVEASNITEDNKLVKCGALVITQLLGIKEYQTRRKKNHSGKEKIESNINALRKDVSLIERWETGKGKSEDKVGSSVSSQKERVQKSR